MLRAGDNTNRNPSVNYLSFGAEHHQIFFSAKGESIKCVHKLFYSYSTDNRPTCVCTVKSSARLYLSQ